MLSYMIRRYFGAEVVVESPSIGGTENWRRIGVLLA